MTKSRVMLGLQSGAEVGFAPMASMRHICIINNQPSIFGRGAIALVQASGLVQKWEEHFEGSETVADPVSDEFGQLDYAPTTRDFPDDFTAVVTIWRKGQ
jgi:hypothetical protein